MAVYWLRPASINILKRKELVGHSVQTQEHTGIVEFLSLDQHIGVRIAGGQPISSRDSRYNKGPSPALRDQDFGSGLRRPLAPQVRIPGGSQIKSITYAVVV